VNAFSTRVRIDASPAEVFPYLTDSALIMRWMGDWGELDPRQGGMFALDINGVPIRGRFLAIEPPHRVVLTWGTPGHERMPAGSTTVEITLREDDGATVLELVHRDLPPEDLAQHGTGWGHFLARLTVVATGADPGPDPWATPDTRELPTTQGLLTSEPKKESS
jgi:uncharacterized protein YndB with AHSA1/START domain